ncbi:MAG: TolC family protein [Bacteroidetes bacterium]|jgi:outer membrane protein TolC|nr:TolC family protein [Bacteroidota bacterium]MBT6685482.1 TolC family protein [Bacteroidota bacterium]MBT7143739.1 TolC family protein [Bacteroidota bacterium]MBT7491462.1 TolC family protein [Bacteroidota bacterium]
MKIIKLFRLRKVLIIVNIVLFSISAYSQVNELENIVYQEFDPLKLISDEIFENEGIALPPLQTLIDSAQIYSPLINQQRVLTEIKEIDLWKSRMDWTEYIGAITQVKYGSITQTDYENLLQDQTVSEASRYNVGLTLRLTLFDILTRGKNIQLVQKELDLANYKKEEVERMVKEEVITKYYTLLLKQRLLSIKNEIHQVQAINYKLAEKEFLEGEIDMSDYAGIIEITAKSSAGLENARIEFTIAYLMLEQAVGREISEIKKAINN